MFNFVACKIAFKKKMFATEIKSNKRKLIFNTRHGNRLESLPTLGEHPFNLKGGCVKGFFRERQFLSENLIEEKKIVSEMGRKNVLLALCALKNIVFLEEKNNVATTCCKKKILPRCEAKKIFDIAKWMFPYTK